MNNSTGSAIEETGLSMGSFIVTESASRTSMRHGGQLAKRLDCQGVNPPKAKIKSSFDKDHYTLQGWLQVASCQIVIQTLGRAQVS